LLDSPFALIRKVAADEKYENDFAFNEKTAGSDSSLRRMNAMKRQSPLLRPAVPAADPLPLSNRRSETDTPVPTHSFRPAIETMSLPFLNLWPHSSFRPWKTASPSHYPYRLFPSCASPAGILL